jgi:CelD/BcsL family acetyltransferase involved in cellulose biosynthesis
MEFNVVTPQQMTAADVSAWCALQAVSGRTSPFLSPFWVQACAAVPGPDQPCARVVILRQAGEAVGFIPVRVRGGTAGPVGAPLCDYQAVVGHADLEVDLRRLLGALRVGRLDFTSLLADQRAFARGVRGVAQSQVIDLCDGYDAYAAARRGAGTDILQDTAKKRRKLEREQGAAVFAVSRDVADFDQLIAWKRAQYRASGQTDIFQAGWTDALLRALFERPADDDPSSFGGAFFTLHVDGKLAAAHFALRQGGGLHAWFIAHDDAFARYSPGVILINEILKWAPANGLHEVDLGPGDYRFKHSLANVKRDVAHGYIGRPSAAALARDAAYRVRATAEALPLGRFSALPGKAMRRLDLLRSLG